MKNAINYNNTSFDNKEAKSTDEIENLAQEVLDWELKNAFVKLVILERKYECEWVKLSDNIWKAISEISKKLDIPPVITYESLILLNDLDKNPLLFSSNDETENKENELLFYKTHQEIEYLFYYIYEEINNLYNLNENDIDKIIKCNRLLKEILKKLWSLMKSMSKEAFNYLRPFWDLSTHYKKKSNGESYPWPSWAFTCWFIYLDVVLWIKDFNTNQLSMDDTMLPKLSGNWYITTNEIEKLKKQVKENWTLIDLFWSESTEVQELIKTIIWFRESHMKASKKYVWEANLERSWTWWSTNAKSFLQQHINDTKALIPNIVNNG